MDGINETAQPIFSGMNPMTPAVFGETQQRLQGEYAQPWEIARAMQGYAPQPINGMLSGGSAGPTGALQSVAEGMRKPHMATGMYGIGEQLVGAPGGGVIDGNASLPLGGQAPQSPTDTFTWEKGRQPAARAASLVDPYAGAYATGVPGAPPIEAGPGMFGAAAKPATSSLESQYTNGWNEATAPVKAPRTGGTDPAPAPQTGGTEPAPAKAPAAPAVDPYLNDESNRRM